ncbi:hypothetical protein [Microbispora sp. H10830]|uniref:hypothetical protein n=1 Tax=Microbispora sp. H10830 TaxID=2729109 RepID=UPI0016004B33|nr:hypothetical protein [Microbispora sp. H10830]
MSLRDDLIRLAHEHEDLAEAIDKVLQPVGALMDRMPLTPGIPQPLSPEDLLREVLRQMSPVGPVVSDVLSRYGAL